MNKEPTMENNNIYNNESVNRADIISVIKSKLGLFKSDASNEEKQGAAYELAGLMSIEFVRGLGADDTITKILEMAGELELPSEIKSESSTWTALIQLIETLD